MYPYPSGNTLSHAPKSPCLTPGVLESQNPNGEILSRFAYRLFCLYCSGAVRILTSNNDCIVRIFDGASFTTLSRFSFPWAVNHTSVSPDGKLVCVVGDDPEGLIADFQTGKPVASLRGHLDFSFATAWHPDGRVFATGNQDTTTR